MKVECLICHQEYDEEPPPKSNPETKKLKKKGKLS